jgi:CRISPR-associated endonuclease/helicase Cas3
LLDLFDTSSDLGGNEIDISRFVRSGEDRNVYVAWRDWSSGDPPENLTEIDEAELCPAPIEDVKELAKKTVFWSWNSLTAQWVRPVPSAIYPGLTLLLHTSEGKYTRVLGWSPESAASVEPISPVGGAPPEGLKDERKSFVSYRQSLKDHTRQVCSEMGALLDALADLDLKPYRADLDAAARQHDWGKAHPIMQGTLHNGPEPYAEILAKQERGKAARGHSRPFFRHELASALAMLAEGESDLATYVTAAHHGRYTRYT